MKPAVIADVVTFLPVLLFGCTAFAKAISRTSFFAVPLHVLPKTGAAVTAFLIPTLEAVAVLLLLSHRTRLGGLCLCAALLGVFTVYLVSMLLALPHLPCSCGGVIGKMSWIQYVAFNLAFWGLTAVAIREKGDGG